MTGWDGRNIFLKSRSVKTIKYKQNTEIAYISLAYQNCIIKLHYIDYILYHDKLQIENNIYLFGFTQILADVNYTQKDYKPMMK